MASIEEALRGRFLPVWVKQHTTAGKEFSPIAGSICCVVLVSVYNLLLRTKEIIPIEDLPREEKQKYWDLALKHNTKTEERTKAAISAYVLEMITQPENEEE